MPGSGRANPSEVKELLCGNKTVTMQCAHMNCDIGIPINRSSRSS